MKRINLNAKYWWDDEQNIITIHQILSDIVITVWILGYFIFLKLQKNTLQFSYASYGIKRQNFDPNKA